MDNKVYLELLNFFCRNSETEWMTKPFQVNNLACATNAKSLIVFDKNFVSNLIDLPETEAKHQLNINQIIAPDKNINYKINVKYISEIIHKYVESEMTKCDACDGSGWVKYEFNHSGKTYTNEAECPICGGSGIVSSLENKFIEIFDCRFSADQIYQLIHSAKLLKTDNVVLCFQYEQKPNIFKIKDVKIVIQPCFKSNQHNIILKLN